MASTQFSVNWTDLSGKKQKKLVTAGTEDEAAAIVGIPRGHLTIKEHRPLFVLKNNKLTTQDQSAILLSTSANIEKGDIPVAALDNALKGLRAGDPSLYPVNQEVSLEANLKALDFFPFSIQMAKVGEQYGSPAECLAAAADYGEKRAEQIAQIKKPLVMSIIYILVSVLVVTFLPVALGPTLEMLMSSMKKLFIPNFASHAIVFLYSTMKNYGVIIYSVIGALIFLIYRKFWSMGKFPIVKTLHKVIWLDRAVLVAESVKIMVPKGVTPPEIFEFLYNSHEGESKRVYHEVVKKLYHGESLPKALDNGLWPAQLVASLSGLEEIATDQLIKIQQSTINLLRYNQSRDLNSLSRMFTLIGMISVGGIIFMVFGGLMVPMIGATGNLRNVI